MELWEIPTMNSAKPIWADEKKRIRLPKPAKPNSGWVPILISEKEMRFVAYEAPRPPSTTKGRVVKGPDGWLVWKGELINDPVAALNADRQDDANG